MEIEHVYSNLVSHLAELNLVFEELGVGILNDLHRVVVLRLIHVDVHH